MAALVSSCDSAEERRRIVHIVVEQAGGRVPVLAGAAEANVKATIDACDAYGAMGAWAVAIVAPSITAQ